MMTPERLAHVQQLIANVGVHSRHGQFLQRMLEQEPAREAIAAHLRAIGWTDVEVPDAWYAPTAADGASGLWSDDGDVFATWRGKRHRIETRGLSQTTFSNSEDFHQPHMIVDHLRKIAAVGDSVSMFFVVSNDLKHAAMIRPSSRPYWYRFDTRNGRDGIYSNYWCAHLIDCEFVRLRGGDH